MLNLTHRPIHLRDYCRMSLSCDSPQASKLIAHNFRTVTNPFLQLLDHHNNGFRGKMNSYKDKNPPKNKTSQTKVCANKAKNTEDDECRIYIAFLTNILKGLISLSSLISFYYKSIQETDTLYFSTMQFAAFTL